MSRRPVTMGVTVNGEFHIAHVTFDIAPAEPDVGINRDYIQNLRVDVGGEPVTQRLTDEELERIYAEIEEEWL